MVKKICLLIIATGLLAGCDTKLRHLTLDKIPYNGDELRIDGYYYSDSDYYNSDTGETHIRIVVFYRDGFCFHIRVGVPANQNILSYIENEILLNDAFIARIKNSPSDMGVFRIMYPNIELETWAFKIDPASWYGNIVNNTTFTINKTRNNRTGEVIFKNLTYRFVEFSPKPDSINNFTRGLVLD